MSHLHYEPDILERVECFQRSQEDRSKGYEDILQILNDRCRLEEFYSRSLERLCEGLQKVRLVNQNEYVRSMVYCMVSLFSSQAEQSQTFGQSVIKEVVDHLRDTLKEEQFEISNIVKLGARHERELFKEVHGFDKVRKQYIHACAAVDKKSREQKNMIQQYAEMKKTHEFSQDIVLLNSLKKRSQEVETEQRVFDAIVRSRLNAENDLKKQIEKYNTYINEYFLDVAKVEDSIVNSELSNRQLLKDSLMKYLVFKVSLIRNLQYDVDRITSKVEQADPSLHLNKYLNSQLAFIKDNNKSQTALKTHKPLLSKLNFDNYKCHIDINIPEKQVNAKQEQQCIPPPQTRSNINNTKVRQKIFDTSVPYSGQSGQRMIFPVIEKNELNPKEEQPSKQIFVQLKDNCYIMRQPSDIRPIDIINFVRLRRREDTICQQNGFIQIERDDFLEYLMLKVWQNNEVAGYDLEQFRSILTGDPTSRNAFCIHFGGFFRRLRDEHRKKLIKEEPDGVNRMLLERVDDIANKNTEMEINSDTYTSLMRILYIALDVLNDTNDLTSLSEIFTTCQSIFKVIRPPDEDITSFQRIFLHQGLSGHPLFTSNSSNQQNWQERLQKIIDTEEKDYHSKHTQDQALTGDQHTEIDENIYIYNQIMRNINHLFLFGIPQAMIKQILLNLIENAHINPDIGNLLIKYIDAYNKIDIPVMQSGEISSQKAQFDNLQKQLEINPHLSLQNNKKLELNINQINTQSQNNIASEQEEDSSKESLQEYQNLNNSKDMDSNFLEGLS